MSFESARRHGRFWEDAITLHDIISEHDFNITANDERQFEIDFASALKTAKKRFNCKVISQGSKSTTVKSVHCFGKRHRPDITLDEDGIAIELKLVDYGGLKQAIGQGYVYRLRYRFVFLVLIISEYKKKVDTDLCEGKDPASAGRVIGKKFYTDLCEGKESDLEHILWHLADNMNIFTYIVPAFGVPSGPGMKGRHAFFPSNEE